MQIEFFSSLSPSFLSFLLPLPSLLSLPDSLSLFLSFFNWKSCQLEDLMMGALCGLLALCQLWASGPYSLSDFSSGFSANPAALFVFAQDPLSGFKWSSSNF